MSEVQNVFGIKKSEIRKTCVLAPVISKDLIAKLNIPNFARTNFYACGSNEHVTLIHTLMGASFVGDAVLHLAETPCERLILFGSCGLVTSAPSLKLGTIVTPFESYAMESFSDLLNNEKKQVDSFAADNDFLNKFLYCLRKENIPSVRCASFGSLVLEEKHKDFLLEENIQVLDMESSAFFFAAKHTHKKAVALFYITDILRDKPVFKPLSDKDQSLVTQSRSQAIDYLVTFINYIHQNN